ncbi:50S ribosome-binding GTPase family protein [Gigaspora margarita]|uniref:50S ribosome-binding GTPase family protein n=1 Tax=Gigaspora margarita TaxID=4874 RepID=A0A8H3X720_GIGMA|nr:50S ribosome-binding GTPase family protein [Gigaspora margarita]
MSSENNLDIEETLTCILQNIEKIDKIFHQQKRQESAIIVVGETREGKTTLLNYLTGISLSSKKNGRFGEFEIHGVDSLNNVTISNGSISQTSLPYNRGEYWDCPGFGDTRGSVQEIINAYSIYKLIKSTKKLKVLAVISENTILEPSEKKLLNFIQNLGEIFNNKKDLVEGLCLVVTRKRSLDLIKIREGLRELLEERDGKEGFSSSQRNILKFLSFDRSQIAFFDAPYEEGPISDKDKSEILNCVEKITYIKNLEPGISIGSDAKSFIKNLIEKFYNDIEEFISKKFDSKFLNYIKDLIDNHDDTVKKLREHLNGLIEELKKISDAKDLQIFENNLDQILSIVKLINNSDLEYELSKSISQLKFFKQVKPETLNIQGNTKSWYYVIKKFINIINFIKSEPKPKINNNKLILEGIIIGIEDIAKEISSSIFEINMYSLNSIFIDEDINAPGVTLTLISPQVRVVGKKRKINLKGKPGLPHNAEKANDGRNHQ